MMKKLICHILPVLLLASCGPAQKLTRGSLYPKMYEHQQAVLLVMPPINNTTNVEAKDLLFTSINHPLAEAGYYVIPPNLSMDILKAESAYDAELFAEAPLGKFRTYFGADAVIFSEINSWAKKGAGIQTNIRYFIRATDSGEVIFDRSCDLYLDLSVSTASGDNSVLGAILSLAATAINTAVTEHIEAARMANNYIFSDLPRGKYSEQYQMDNDVEADAAVVSKYVK